MKILVIEDEAKVAGFIKKGLEEQGYEVALAYDGQMGERLAVKGDFSLIILDVILPYINGFDLCRKIRSKNEQVAIIMLTALGTTDDKVDGFDAGADDYIVKPFEFKELLARIKALTKRSSGIIHTTNTLRVADLELDLNKRIAKRSGKSIDLTAKEFLLLEYFMRNKGKVVSRSDISEKVWDINFDTGTNIVDVYVNILRKKIDKDYESKLLHTRIGMGYIFDSE